MIILILYRISLITKFIKILIEIVNMDYNMHIYIEEYMINDLKDAGI